MCAANSDTPANASWHKVADAAELADGELKMVRAGGQVLVLIRIGDRYGALDNQCPHAGGPLAQGSLEDGLLVCPWHGHEYDPISGSCEGYAAVRAYKVDARADGIYVALE